MSAWPDRPDDFLHWAAKRAARVSPGDFLPRQWYGEYVRETLLDDGRSGRPVRRAARSCSTKCAASPAGPMAAGSSTGRGASVRGRRGRARHRPSPAVRSVRQALERSADSVHRRPLAAVRDECRSRPDESVVVLGSGLTAVDAVLSLAHPSRRRRSRSSRAAACLPQAHAASPLTPVDLQPLVAELLAAPGGVASARASVARFAAGSRARPPQGVDWRSVVDGVRPAHRRAVAGACRSRRAAPVSRPPAAVLGSASASHGAGDRANASASCATAIGSTPWPVASCSVQAERRRRAARSSTEPRRRRAARIDADWVVNCTGPAPSNSAASNPAIGSLLVDGWLQARRIGPGHRNDRRRQRHRPPWPRSGRPLRRRHASQARRSGKAPPCRNFAGKPPKSPPAHSACWPAHGGRRGPVSEAFKAIPSSPCPRGVASLPMGRLRQSNAHAAA